MSEREYDIYYIFISKYLNSEDFYDILELFVTFLKKRNSWFRMMSMLRVFNQSITFIHIIELLLDILDGSEDLPTLLTLFLLSLVTASLLLCRILRFYHPTMGNLLLLCGTGCRLCFLYPGLWMTGVLLHHAFV